MSPTHNGEVGVGLAEAIANIRAELVRATTEGADSEIGFEPGPIELEFEIGFQSTKSGGGAIRAYVLTLDAKAQAARSTTHRLKFTLTPSRRSGPVGARTDELIADQEKE